MAEHSPTQLFPCPQVTLVTVVSLAQQLTWIDSLRKVKDESTKSTLVVEVLPEKEILDGLKSYSAQNKIFQRKLDQSQKNTDRKYLQNTGHSPVLTQKGYFNCKKKSLLIFF